jgi:DNA-binding NtrC family response regulator
VQRPEISDDAMDKLLSYSYPGNVRELENILERAVTLCSDDRIEPVDIQLKQGQLLADLPGCRVCTMMPLGADGLEGQLEHISARLSSGRWSRRGITRRRRRSCWG